jgi:hypothetical protein
VRVQKRRRPAADSTANGPSDFSVGQLRDRNRNSTPLTYRAIYDGRVLLGFLRPIGGQGVESIDANHRSLGIFADAIAAANALTAMRGQA